ncbi:Rrf2 family protein [Thalassospira sp. MBR-102]|jgi:Rrf2 family protein|uniref:Transcriptional regulator n=3 Tax=Thalassospira TaxID=168934 RepID=A0ABR5Y7J3_9PROT|nr:MULTISPECIES: Rrf2 family transcriptional regulator [Thalassospira]MBR9781572.1 Rrf2 family transcriptional regulator [Rhodospirillales bacterium]AJD51668.1 BadM/Rrf2 family transcriptional regulator [Thalassospira xiamenensis M-5 = DSM 17429]KEO58876.1 transcriptional regulator [Thalassospira permensis NBRC 106175]KZD06885.1 transcriptional regulator [Thalassospira xiamenensis]KZD09173.1 transcriptional regulator [Thalassospira xiamenensis]|tara:strand:- start:339 stop:785 length:447 start_codon:yes stop_codon:yes gene_type:complete
MMSLQKATLFALYAVLELAEDTDRQLSASEIAERYNISTNHLAKVLRDLGRAGLVESVRGAGGGYRFCGNAKRTTLLDVVRLFEEVGAGPTSGIVQDTNAGVALSQVMDEIEEITHATLLSISIETMLKLMRKRRPEKPRSTGLFRAV